MYLAVVKGKDGQALALAKEEIEKGEKPGQIIDSYLIPAINHVGELFEKGTYFLPQLIASAEAMEKAGEGIANQRKAIALGIKDSLEIIQETGVGNDEANQLFMFTQWSEMMTEFARTGKTSTVVLPSDFSQSASMFEQMLTAGKVQSESKE